MDVDASLNAIGLFGRRQIANFLILGLTTLCGSIQFTGVAFTVDQSVPFFCMPPAGFSANQTTPYLDRDGVQVQDGCHIYGVVNGTLMDNKTTCQNGWEYENTYGETSITTDLDLVCDRSLLAGTLMSVHFIGIMVGSLVLGHLSDVFGRRPITLLCLLVVSVIGSSISFTWNFELMLVLRFLLGFAVPGLCVVVYTRAVEMFTPEYRLLGGVINQGFWSLGLTLEAPIAYLLPKWRTFQLVVSLACVPLLLAHWFFSYESIRWLVQKGRISQAVAILKMISKSNENATYQVAFPIPSGHVDGGAADQSQEKPAFEAEDRLASTNAKRSTKRYTILDLFKTKTLIKHTLILYFIRFANNIAYFGFLLFATSLSENKYLSFFLLALIELPGYVHDYFLVKRFGRRRPLSFFLIACAMACLTIAFLPVRTANGTDLSALVVAIAMIGKFYTNGAYELGMLVGAELFPTMLRNAGTGSATTFGGIGTIVAPFLLPLKDVASFLPLIIMAVLALLAGLCVLLLPETHGARLPETYEDSNKTTHERGERTDV